MTRRFSVPQSIAQAVQDRWPTEGETWAPKVPDELRELCHRYEAEPRQVLPARYGFVVEVETPRATRLVLRSTPDPNAEFQTAVVGKLAELGIGPRIHEVMATDTSTWTVSERIIPGSSLFDAQAPASAIARVLRAMNDQKPPLSAMPSLTHWLRSRLNDGDLTDLPPGQQPAPHRQRQRALSVLDQIEQSSVPELCHGDLSPGNLLVSEQHGLLAIDPRGVTGEAAYDVAVAAMKVAFQDQPFQDQPMKNATHLAHLTDMDPDRVTAWVSIADAARV